MCHFFILIVNLLHFFVEDAIFPFYQFGVKFVDKNCHVTLTLGIFFVVNVFFFFSFSSLLPQRVKIQQTYRKEDYLFQYRVKILYRNSCRVKNSKKKQRRELLFSVESTVDKLRGRKLYRLLKYALYKGHVTIFTSKSNTKLTGKPHCTLTENAKD